MTDDELINMHAQCGGGLVTKESILQEHQQLGGDTLNWEQLRKQHIKFGQFENIPVGIHNVTLGGDLRKGFEGLVINEVRTEFQEYPTCPYCGAVIREYYELGDDECGEVECGSCEREFEYVRHMDIKFSTKKIRCDKIISSKLCEYILERIFTDFEERNIKVPICRMIEIKEYIEGSIENFLKFEIDYSKGDIGFEDLIQLVDKKYVDYYEVVELASLEENSEYIR